MDSEASSRTHRQTLRSRLRPLLIVCGVSLLALCAGVVLGSRALIGSFTQVEDAATAQKAMQVYRAFDADLNQLAISNRDYAEWDDAAAYITTADPDFIDHNFSDASLSGMFVDVVWIVDAQGAQRHSAYLDRKTGQLHSPAPPAVLQAFEPVLSRAKELSELAPSHRILLTPQGPAAFSALEIKRSDRSHSTGAVMLFARFIREAEVARMRTTSHLPISLGSLAPGANTMPALPGPVQTWISSHPQEAEPTTVFSPDERETSGYAFVRTLDGAPAVLFTTTGPRDILSLGFRTTWTLLTAIVVLLIGFGVAVAALFVRLQKSVAARYSAQARYEGIGDQLREAIVLVDARSHQVINANGTTLRALGCKREEVTSRNIQQLFPEITTEILQAAAAPDAGRQIHKTRLRRWNGAWTDTEVSITAMDDGGPPLLILVAHDISHRKEAAAQERENKRKLLQLAQNDALTGLPNRLYLRTRLPQVLEKIANSDRLLALMYVDVDRFKNINDSRGHACGDQLLQIIAKRLRATVSMNDLVARMGGDEFVVVATLMQDRAAIDDLAARLQTAVSAPIMINDEPLTVSASIGIAVYPDDGLQIDSLLKNADIALYQAKEAGRACHRFFQSDMDLRLSEHVALEQALRHALGSEQIFLEYQPIIDLNTGRVASLEALMRWRHPDRGLIPPSRFIPVAEQSGLIADLGQQALREVVSQLRRWLDEDVPVVPIAVNVSPLQLERLDFAAIVAQLLKEKDVDPRWLRFEITESAVMKEPEKLIATLQTLRDLGSHILIDDFGTGYSSLSYLNRLPIDVLKIDQAFVRDLGKDTGDKPIIGAVIDLARKLDLLTVAEGVETADQAALLREQGCNYAQGYHFSKPIPASQCRWLLQQLRREHPLTQTMVVRVASESFLTGQGSP